MELGTPGAPISLLPAALCLRHLHSGRGMVPAMATPASMPPQNAWTLRSGCFSFIAQIVPPGSRVFRFLSDPEPTGNLTVAQCSAHSAPLRGERHERAVSVPTRHVYSCNPTPQSRADTEVPGILRTRA